MLQERIFIVAKMDWERLLAGHSRTITVFKETDLHHEFGDRPEKHVIRIKITELPTSQT